MSKSSCLLCGSQLVYSAETQGYTCELCKDRFDSNAVCRQGHYVCEPCDSAPADEIIEKVCLNSTSTQPVELAVSLLNMLSVPMQGPLNRYLVPAVLLAAYYNQLQNEQEKRLKLRMAREKSADVIGDFCGPHGVCITGIGTGIFISLIADSHPESEGTWGLANQMTNESLRCIEALGEFRCCKRDTLMAIKTAQKFVNQNFQVNLDVPELVACQFNFYHQDCLKENCPFRPLEN